MDDDDLILGLYHLCGRVKWSSGLMTLPGQAQGIAAIWKVNQWMKDIFLSVHHCFSWPHVSSFVALHPKINKYINKNFKKTEIRHSSFATANSNSNNNVIVGFMYQVSTVCPVGPVQYYE